jgi:hypothetical protein
LNIVIKSSVEYFCHINYTIDGNRNILIKERVITIKLGLVKVIDTLLNILIPLYRDISVAKGNYP